MYVHAEFLPLGSDKAISQWCACLSEIKKHRELQYVVDELSSIQAGQKISVNCKNGITRFWLEKDTTFGISFLGHFGDSFAISIDKNIFFYTWDINRGTSVDFRKKGSKLNFDVENYPIVARTYASFKSYLGIESGSAIAHALHHQLMKAAIRTHAVM